VVRERTRSRRVLYLVTASATTTLCICAGSASSGRRTANGVDRSGCGRIVGVGKELLDRLVEGKRQDLAPRPSANKNPAETGSLQVCQCAGKGLCSVLLLPATCYKSHQTQTRKHHRVGFGFRNRGGDRGRHREVNVVRADGVAGVFP
jgi:hypothetical protein